MEIARILGTAIVAALVACFNFAHAQSGGTYEVTRFAVHSGGGAMAGGDYAITDVIAQPLADVASGGSYQVTSGFLSPLDLTPPTSSAAADAIQVGGNLTGTYVANDTGSAIASVVLYVREPGGAWTHVGAITGGAWSYTPSQSGDAADGVYEFATVATDNASNSETAPSGAGAGDVAVLYNNAANSNFAHASIADGIFTFPMTTDLSVLITFAGGASGGPITVSRTVGDVAPAGFAADRLIDESLSIAGTFTGTATIEWNFAPGFAGTLDTVFKFNGGTLSGQFPVTPAGTTIAIPGVTSFSDWYAGSNNATVGDWTLLED